MALLHTDTMPTENHTAKQWQQKTSHTEQYQQHRTVPAATEQNQQHRSYSNSTDSQPHTHSFSLSLTHPSIFIINGRGGPRTAKGYQKEEWHPYQRIWPELLQVQTALKRHKQHSTTERGPFLWRDHQQGYPGMGDV